MNKKLDSFTINGNEITTDTLQKKQMKKAILFKCHKTLIQKIAL